MDFSQALKELKNGKAIKIRGNKVYFMLDKDNNIIYYDGEGRQAKTCSFDVDAVLSDKWETSYYKQDYTIYSKEYKEALDKIKVLEDKCCHWEVQCKNTVEVLEEKADTIDRLKKEIEKNKADKSYLEGQISILREMLGK